MLVVLCGESLPVYATALSLLESYGPTGVQILILENKFGEVSTQLSLGPLPWCVTSLSGLPIKRFINTSTYQRSESSTMFLESVSRSCSSARLSLDSPSSTHSLVIKPSPQNTNMLLYHPSVLKSYLRNLLSIQRNVSWAAIMANNQNIEDAIRHSLYNSQSLTQKFVIVRISSTVPPKLQAFNLSHVKWVGMRDLRLPNTVLVLRKYQSIVDAGRNHNSRDHTIEIQTSAASYDLLSALRIGQYVERVIDDVLVRSGQLKWSRL